MRFAEILRPATAGAAAFAVEFTKQFARDYREFSAAWPGLADTFAAFLDAKRANWSAPFNAKDSPTSRHIFKGWGHCHLVFGKAVLCYTSRPGLVRCARLTDHLPFDGPGPRAQALSAYLERLSDADFAPAPSRAAAPAAPDPKLLAAARDLFYEMAANDEDRKLLRAFVDGRSDDALEFLALAEPPVQPSVVGGIGVLRTLAAAVLRAVPLDEAWGGPDMADGHLHHSTDAPLASLRRAGLRSSTWEDEEFDHLVGPGVFHALFFTDRVQDEYGETVLRFPTTAVPRGVADSYSPDRGLFLHARRPFAVSARALEVRTEEGHWVPLRA